MDLRTADFDYALPEELIAQHPTETRGESRLMVVHRQTGDIEHRAFADFPTFFQSGDVLVANRSRVLPARLMAHRETGGAVELLLLRRLDADRWTTLARPSRKLRVGSWLNFPHSTLRCEIVRELGDGQWEVRFTHTSNVDAELQRIGTVPLPPYIRESLADPERYQTVYADQTGSVAAPTAGLHFSKDMLATLECNGIAVRYVTLHVGLGTFRPVVTDRVLDHTMHAEWGEVPPEVASELIQARARDRRVVAIGTTSTRILESAAASGEVHPFRGETDIFIYPGYTFRAIDALLTNFHLPKSTLLMLVSALAGKDVILRAYAEAVEQRYRFFSFGDAMLIV